MPFPPGVVKIHASNAGCAPCVALFLVPCFSLLSLEEKNQFDKGCHGEVMLDWADSKGHNDTALQVMN